MVQDEGRLAADANRGPAPRPGDDWAPRPEETPPPPPPSQAGGGAKRAAREIIETLLLAVVIFFVVRLFVANFRVDGLSMADNLDDGQMLLVNANAYQVDLNRIANILPGEDRTEARTLVEFDPPERGDIVVFNPPPQEGSDKPFIKRVIGLPGERVTFRGGDVYVNGVVLDEEYIPDDVATDCNGGGNCRVTVPPEHVYVLGDNRENSEDGRAFGPIDTDAIIGKAWLSYWPLDDFGPVPHYDYPDVPERPNRAVVGTPVRVATAEPRRTPGAARPRREEGSAPTPAG